jgi:hypothetical protein
MVVVVKVASEHGMLKLNDAFLPSSCEGLHISGTLALSSVLEKDPSCTYSVTSAAPPVQLALYSSFSELCTSFTFVQTMLPDIGSVLCVAIQLIDPLSFQVCNTLKITVLETMEMIDKGGLSYIELLEAPSSRLPDILPPAVVSVIVTSSIHIPGFTGGIVGSLVGG